MKPKVLFITNKWVDGPNSPVSFHYEGLIQTFAECVNGYEYDMLALDESYDIYDQHVDSAIDTYCSKTNVDAIIVIRIGVSGLNPSVECLKKYKGKKFICFIWEDSNPWDLQYQHENEDLIDLNVILDNPSYQDKVYVNSQPKYATLWTPESTRIYHPMEQDIPVSFIGSLRYAERAEYIPYVKEKIPELFTGGGQREDNVSVYKYAEYIARSMMTINFPSHGMGYKQVKGKVLHALACRTLLLERENASTRNLLEPGIDYVEFSSKDDLCDKIKYYQKNDKERLEIATNGYNKYMKKYTAKIFWDTVIGKIKV